MSLIPVPIMRLDDTRERERELRAATEHRRRIRCPDTTRRNPRTDG